MKKWVILALSIPSLFASPLLMETNCAECHNEEKSRGKFKLTDLGAAPTTTTLDLWIEALDLVDTEEMPPEDEAEISSADRKAIIAFLDQNIQTFQSAASISYATKPRRLNNREFANSIRDALLLPDIGTHLPTDNLVGDSLHDGFDTHSDTLGFSKFHLEQFLESARKIVDAHLLSGDRPPSKTYTIPAGEILRKRFSHSNSPELNASLEPHVFDFLDPKAFAYFKEMELTPTSGNYRITIEAIAKDRGIYPSHLTGFLDEDPVQLEIRLGDRVHGYDLPDEEVVTLEIDEWIAAGTRIRLYNPTDAFTGRFNGNFKFQYGIPPTFLKKNDPARYHARIKEIKEAQKKSKQKKHKNLHRYQNWIGQWQGARPRLLSVEIEGPHYETWPPKHQVALLGKNPSVENAEAILRPIAERAWRRPLRENELAPIVALVKSRAKDLGEIEALKEGIVNLFVSPAFLILNGEDHTPADRFASKLSYFLQSTLPTGELRERVATGKLASFDAILANLQSEIEQASIEPFLLEFPHAWLQLDDINFMSPDPDEYKTYHRKRVSEDMVAEVKHFFRHAVEKNISIPEFLSADYSFINYDLAQVYNIKDIPEDSILRKYTFTDGRRGGLLGMGAFLTATADSLSTSPIHRAVYVMENFFGIHPTPPPVDVEITEPDVRQAKTIKEVLAAHTSQENCASCHSNIDPYGYAFENFDPIGAWRDEYIIPKIINNAASEARDQKANSEKEKTVSIPVDASSKFRNGTSYQNIIDFRKVILSDINRDRFVRCFITKLLTYANGQEPEPTHYREINAILAKSAQHNYQIRETIAAVIDSPLFREISPE